MLIQSVLFTDLEILDEVLEVLKGPPDADPARATLSARAIAALEANEARLVR